MSDSENLISISPNKIYDKISVLDQNSKINSEIQIGQRGSFNNPPNKRQKKLVDKTRFQA